MSVNFSNRVIINKKKRTLDCLL